MTERKATSSANDPHERKVDQEPTYDLTTYEGMRKAAIDFAGKNPKKAAAMGVMAALNPFLVPAIYLGNKAIDSLSNTFKDPVEVIDAQCKAAVDLIKAGKDNGAKKIKVTVDQQAGVDIGGKLEGYSMKFSFGSDNKMTIDVEYWDLPISNAYSKIWAHWRASGECESFTTSCGIMGCHRKLYGFCGKDAFVEKNKERVMESENGFAKEFSDAGFWDKALKFSKAAGKEVIEKALISYYALQSSDTPAWAKTVIVSALGYFISPVDAIPDVIPMIGYADDLGVLTGALATIAMSITDEIKGKAKSKLTDWFGD